MIKNQDTENLLRHEPWFSFVQKGIERAEFYEDVVLANNCLTEMSPRALAFYLKVLEKGSDSPIWICQGFGGRRILTKSLIWHAQEVIPLLQWLVFIYLFLVRVQIVGSPIRNFYKRF